MYKMFSESEFNGDISEWNVSNVTNMNGMFLKSKFNGNISEWNVSNVTSMYEMFQKSKFNGDISKWNVSNVTNMSYMFEESEFNRDISMWKIDEDCNIEDMFFNSRYSFQKPGPYKKTIGDKIWNKLTPVRLKFLNESDRIDDTKEICKDIIYILDESEYKVNEFVKNKEHVVLVNNDGGILCYSLETIQGFIDDWEKWLLECTSELIEGTNDKKMTSFGKEIYAGIPINEEGFMAYIELPIIKGMFEDVENGNRIFYVVPKLDENNTQVYLTHTVSYQNTVEGKQDFVSTNHCQGGSSILVYTLEKS